MTGPAVTGRDRVLSVLRRESPGRFVYAPNYWQWFAHQRNHGLLPAELGDCAGQLDLIRRLGLEVFSRNIYCDPTRCWFGGLSRETAEGFEIAEHQTTEGADRVTDRSYRCGPVRLDERLRHIGQESTLVQERFLLDGGGDGLDALEKLVAARRWRFDAARFAEVQREIGDAGVAVAGELFSPLKLLHLAAGAANAVFLLEDHPDQCRAILALHEEAQLDLLRQMLAGGVTAAMAMDNLDASFHPPDYVERCSAGFYERAARLCREAGAVFFIHACGRQRALLPLIGSLGVDGLEGVAFPPLGDVELDEAMRLGGDRLILTGGISAAEFLRLTTREAVFAYVRDLFTRMRPFAHRFMFSASCNTPYTAPWQAIVWFRDAWREYGGSG